MARAILSDKPTRQQRAQQRNGQILKLRSEGKSGKEIAEALRVRCKLVWSVLSDAKRAKKVIHATFEKRWQLPPREKFWSRVNTSGGNDSCWEWTMGRHPVTGYGRVHTLGRYWYTHHLAFYFGHHRLAKLWVLHKCGNSSCCNPAHLYEGTPKQNCVDRDLHGRTNRASRPRITEEAVRTIFDGRLSIMDAAKETGFHYNTVQRIRKHGFERAMRRAKGMHITYKRKVTPEMVDAILNRPKGVTVQSLAAKFGISNGTAWRISSGAHSMCKSLGLDK